jgi:hypothetical protein
MQFDPSNTEGGGQDGLWLMAQSCPLKKVPVGQIGVVIGFVTHHFPSKLVFEGHFPLPSGVIAHEFPCQIMPGEQQLTCPV